MVSLDRPSLNRQDFVKASEKIYGTPDVNRISKRKTAGKYWVQKTSKVIELFRVSIEANEFNSNLIASLKLKKVQVILLHSLSALWMAASMVLVTVRFLPGMIAPALVFRNIPGKARIEEPNYEMTRA